jgi:hypothetical protein
MFHNFVAIIVALIVHFEMIFNKKEEQKPQRNFINMKDQPRINQSLAHIINVKIVFYVHWWKQIKTFF